MAPKVENQSMAVVAYDDRSYSLDGNRIWLVSGAIHYYRVPEALWSDRLLKAKRCGLNCVSTHVAWNFHELREGQWDFAGDQDIAKFVKLAGEMGLYVILKPGPYVGGELDGGGLPGWLGTKSGMAYRANNASFIHYFDKYFRHVLARLADLQVTRGGNIVLIQNECEYTLTTMPDRQSYLDFISQLFRRSGFEIPIITSNLLTELPVAGAVECASGWNHIVHRLKQLRGRQPKAPLMASPFWCGEPDCWGQPHAKRDDLQAARTALEILGCGGQIDYTMWHGGTNFGFWGGRSSRAESWYVTTSYDCDAPLAEGGGLTRKYYLTRLVNMLAGSMGSYFASCQADAPGVSIHDATQAFNLSGPMGRWAIISSGGRSDIPAVRVSTPSGAEFSVSLAPLGAVAIPVDLALTPTSRLDWANLMPLGFFGGKVMVFHGEPGWEAQVSVNGSVVRQTVPEGDATKTVQVGELTLIFINSDLAMRTWLVSGSLVFGPEFVGGTVEEISDRSGAKQFHVLPLDSEAPAAPAGGNAPAARKAKPHKPAAPKLGPWKRAGVCAEPTDKELQWQRIDRPQDVDKLGAHQGYAWYQIAINQDKPARKELFLPDCEDRAALYLNGAPLGVWGRGPGATRELMSASLHRGPNVITVLADNLGRFCDEPNLGQPRGLFGHVYGAASLPLDILKRKPFEGFNRRMIPRTLVHLTAELEASPVWSIEIPVSLPRVAPIHLSFADVPHHVAVLCNDRQAKFFPRSWTGTNFGDLKLGNELKKGRNLIKLLVWGAAAPDLLKKFRLHLLEENLTEGGAWSFRRWTTPEPGGRVVGKDMPAWYVSHFKYSPWDEPLFLHIIGAKKGQVFLNGNNVGRFWTVGPQEDYYLPSCWLKEENELMLFEEQGLIPAGSALDFRRLGPYHKEA
jgi:hypothetical protein